MKNIMIIFINDENNFFQNNWNNFFWILIIFLIISTLIFKESLDSIKGASILAVMSIFTFVIGLTIIFLYKLSSEDYNISWDPKMLWPQGTVLEFIGSLPTVSLAFSFQISLFPIYFSIVNKTNEKILLASKIGVNFSLFVYLFTGYVGFFMYYGSLNDSILNSFLLDGIKAKESKDYFIMMVLVSVNIAFMTNAVMGIPLMFLSLKQNFINTIIFWRKKFTNKNEDIEKKDDVLLQIIMNKNEGIQKSNINTYNISRLSQKLITICLYISLCIISILVPNLKTVFYI